jgi:hypothetical protein
MKSAGAAEAIRIRLKYNWIVQLYGLLCVLIQFVCKGNWEYFFLLCGAFFLVQVFGVPVYRELQNGGEAMHWIADQTLNQNSSFDSVFLRMVAELLIITFVSLYFLFRTIHPYLN